jgi:tetratricopeptide (TPR) repeat protein
MYKPATPDSAAAAISLFERALALDPQSVEAQSLLTVTLVGRVLNGMSDTAKADIKRAEELATEAVAASPQNPLAHLAKAIVLRVQRRCAEAIPEYETVLALNRNSASALADIGRCRIFAGPIEEAIPLEEQAIRLSPRDPRIAFFGITALGKRICSNRATMRRSNGSKRHATPMRDYGSFRHTLPPPTPSKARPNAPPRNWPKRDG